MLSLTPSLSLRLQHIADQVQYVLRGTWKTKTSVFFCYKIVHDIAKPKKTGVKNLKHRPMEKLEELGKLTEAVTTENFTTQKMQNLHSTSFRANDK